jgi:hypothetical protein
MTTGAFQRLKSQIRQAKIVNPSYELVGPRSSSSSSSSSSFLDGL